MTRHELEAELYGRILAAVRGELQKSLPTPKTKTPPLPGTEPAYLLAVDITAEVMTRLLPYVAAGEIRPGAHGRSNNPSPDHPE